MFTIDAQVHVYGPSTPEHPRFFADLHGPSEVSGADMLAAMAEAGVDAALLVSPYTIYGHDPSYALDVYKQFPNHFRVITPVDRTDPAVGDRIADWASTDGAVGVRLVLLGDEPIDPSDPNLNLVFDSAARHSLPVNVMCWGRLELCGVLARRHPDTIVIVDHLGLKQPILPPVHDDPFKDLPNLLKLAAYRNVMVKFTGAFTLSKVSYPFPDVWGALEKVFRAFGLDRCMWGSDWTRAIEFLTYRQAVDPFLQTELLSDSDKEKLMGGNIRRVYSWKQE